MRDLVPLVVVVPLMLAALLAAVSRWLPRRAPDLLAVLGAVAVTWMSVTLMLGTRDQPLVYWFGGWHPVDGLPIGIDFVVDPIAGAMASLASVLTVASLVFAWHYFDDVGHLFHSLVLLFLAGMVGFALSGDLFNIFVWLELMSVAAYALCGYQIHQAGVVQGAVNFAIINSLGTFTMLFGIALVYAVTGQLNLSGIGHELSTHGTSPPVVVGFAFLTVGFLVKAGAVPFHFWLSDAYAVASAPVGALFAGVMSDLAYHAFARTYWDGFAGGFQEDQEAAVRDVLLVLAVATMVVGAVMCWLQSDLKRQLAFLTISHGGIFLAGIALLTPRGMAGATLYVVTDGVLKGALFLSFGVVIHRLGTSDELALHGRGRGLLVPGALFVCSAIGLSAAPPLGTFLSSALILDSPGYPWLSPVVAAATAVTAGTVLRAAGRIYLGWGSPDDPLLTRDEPHEPEEGEPDQPDRVGTLARTVLLTPAFLLVAVGFGLSFVPGIAPALIGESQEAQDHVAREQLVLHGEESPPAAAPTYEPSVSAWGYGAASAAGSVVLATAALRMRPRRGRWRRALRATRALKAVHDGAVGDYAVWLTAGLGAITTVWAVTLR